MSAANQPLKKLSFPTWVPVGVFFYVLVILPFMEGDGQPRIVNMLFWPVLTIIVVAYAISNSSRLDKRFILAPPIASLIAYLLFAGASIVWAYSPNFAFTRYVIQVLIVIIIFVPYALSISTEHTLQRIHACCAIGVVIHAYFVLTTPGSPIGHPGYFTHKQELGMFCGATIILAAHELLYRGWRRIFALFTICLTVWVVIASESKSPLPMLLAAMAVAAVTQFVFRWVKVSPALIVGCFVLVALLFNNPIERLAFRLYGDATITGRTFIWTFIDYIISQRSWFGWGFHSYWTVPDSPHNLAPGFIKDMISAHSGYLELKLDTGYLGYWIFLVFIYASLHCMMPVMAKYPRRAWAFLSFAGYILLLNLTESIWLQTHSLWIIYLIIVAEAVRVAHDKDTRPSSSQVRAVGRGKFAMPVRTARGGRSRHVAPVR